ncbi:uncharacterized protein LOC142549476 isoform X2 [Primulina tabacum]|uniref:uncharacterized protein LOC142549476 isoform X2 n=1 Tax=Primulina tabacum TaxID=48773 RepID=UPI003F591E8D
MLSSLTLSIMDGAVVFSARRLSSSNSLPPTTFRWGLKRKQDTRLHPRRSQAILLANPNVSPDKGNSKKEVVMVDPLEAKRLASKQMAQIKAKEKLRKQRQIEAINGAWAMIGLTVGLVIEGGTGKSIIAQLAGYWAAFIGFFVR